MYSPYSAVSELQLHQGQSLLSYHHDTGNVRKSAESPELPISPQHHWELRAMEYADTVALLTTIGTKPQSTICQSDETAVIDIRPKPESEPVGLTIIAAALFKQLDQG